MRKTINHTATEVLRELNDNSLDELLSHADVVSIHCPLFPETQGLINKNTIKLIKTAWQKY